MKKNCLACGIEKDTEIFEKYRYDEGVENPQFIDEPIEPFFELDCQPYGDKEGWRRVSICHECFYKLDPDMWISSDGWESLKPVVSFDDLPLLDNED